MLYRFVAIILGLLPLLLPLPAPAATVASTVRVSGPSPLQGCTDPGLVAHGPAIVFPNAEVEPRIAVNPQKHGNLIGVWQQDRWSNGGARGVLAVYSFDGGRSWGTVPLPFGHCVDPTSPYTVVSDPWISIGPDGTAYVSVLVASDAATGVQTATSTDGGKTWNVSRTVISEPTASGNDDKEAVTADPKRPHTAYVVWARSDGPSPDGQLETWFARTTDGGKTWSAPREIVQEAWPGDGIQGNQIVVDRRTGTLYTFFFHIFVRPKFKRVCSASVDAATCIKIKVKDPGLHSYIAVVRSTDGGKSWSKPHNIAPFEDASYPPSDVRTGDPGPQVAIDGRTGTLYLLWNDGTPSIGLIQQTLLSRSTDGGVHWSTPAVVGPAIRAPTFTSSIAVNGQGVVGITYYSTPEPEVFSTKVEPIPTSCWFTASSDGGKHFSTPLPLSNTFDLRSAPVAYGNFLGDYEGLAAGPTDFYAFFAAANTGDKENPTDIYTAAITP